MIIYMGSLARNGAGKIDDRVPKGDGTTEFRGQKRGSFRNSRMNSEPVTDFPLFAAQETGDRDGIQKTD
jgi:hypothetical protein